MQIASVSDCLARSVEDCLGFVVVLFCFCFPSLEVNELLGHSFMKQAGAAGSETTDLW